MTTSTLTLHELYDLERLLQLRIDQMSDLHSQADTDERNRKHNLLQKVQQVIRDEEVT